MSSATSFRRAGALSLSSFAGPRVGDLNADVLAASGSLLSTAVSWTRRTDPLRVAFVPLLRPFCFACLAPFVFADAAAVAADVEAWDLVDFCLVEPAGERFAPRVRDLVVMTPLSCEAPT